MNVEARAQPENDPFMGERWICLVCNSKLNVNNIKEHRTKTAHMEYLRDTLVEHIYPEQYDTLFQPENITPQRQAWQNIIKKTGLNLPSIGFHPCMSTLEDQLTGKDCIIIGAGPSIQKNDHLITLLKSDYKGAIMVTDRMLKPCLEMGITPERFPDFYVNTLDDSETVGPLFYKHSIIKHWARKISFLFATNIHPDLVQIIEFMDPNAVLFWYQPLRDYTDMPKSMDRILRVMFAAYGNTTIPLIADGGNVGTCSWQLCQKILKPNRIALIGFDMSQVNDPHYLTMPKYKQARIEGSYHYFRQAFGYMLAHEPDQIETINCTEGGALRHPNLKSMPLVDFLNVSP